MSNQMLKRTLLCLVLLLLSNLTLAWKLQQRSISRQEHLDSGLDNVDISDVLAKRVSGGKPVDPLGLGVGLILMSAASTTTVGLCTGTFISKNLMLTAAHCVSNSKSFNIFVPQTNQSDPLKTTVLMLHDRASNVYYDSTYHLTPEMVPVNDIALLQFSEPYTGTLMRLDRTADKIGYNNGQQLRVCGFGDTQSSSQLQPGWFPFACLDGTITQSQVCKQTLKGTLDANQFCIQFDNGRGSACHGDSGGPSWSLGKLPNGNSVLVQVGVTSWGASDCNSNVTVFTRICDYQSVVARVVCSVQGSDDDICQLYSDGTSYSPLSATVVASPSLVPTQTAGKTKVPAISVAPLSPPNDTNDATPDDSEGDDSNNSPVFTNAATKPTKTTSKPTTTSVKKPTTKVNSHSVKLIASWLIFIICMF